MVQKLVGVYKIAHTPPGIGCDQTPPGIGLIDTYIAHFVKTFMVLGSCVQNLRPFWDWTLHEE